jgi:hypothetical protein
VRVAAPRLRWNDAFERPMVMPTGEKVMVLEGPARMT